MSIVDGSPVNAANVNANLMSKNVDNVAAGKQTFTETTQSSSKDTGAVVLEGGLGVEKNINAGGSVSGSNLSGTNTGDVTLNPVGSSPNSNAATLSGQILILQPADLTNPGVVTTSQQSFSGEKIFEQGKFNEAIRLGYADDVATTGSNATLPHPDAPIHRLTNASLVSIEMIDTPDAGFTFILTNDTGNSISILNETGATANEQIVTGSGASITMINKSSLLIIYDDGLDKWRVVGGGGGGTSFLDNLFEVKDDSDPTKKVVFQASGITTGTTRTVSVPDMDLTLLGTSSTQAITNKDIDGGTASNTNRVTIPKDTLANLQALTRKEGTIVYATDTDKFYSDNGTTLVPVGSGSGAKNYFTDGDAEGSNPFTLFNDGSAIWVDGTGGSPTATITQSATNPLSGQKSFLFTSGTQYDTAKASITIDREDKYKVQTLEISYEVASGTYASGDLQLFLYDSTNGAILYASPVSDIAASGINAKMQFAFQATDSLTYQILIHQKTSATFTMKFEMKIGPQFQAGYAPISTDPVSFDTSVGTWLKAVTSDPTSYGTIVRNVGMMSRHGGKMNYTWQFEQSSAGSGGSGTYLLKLPYKIDLTKYGLSQSYVDTSFNLEVLAEGELFAYYNNGSDSGVAAHLYIYDESTLYAAIKSNSGTYNFWSSSFFELTASGTMSYNIWVNIWTLGQSAETKVISEYDGRRVSATAYVNTGYTPAANDYVNFDTIVEDSHGCITTGTGTSWRYTAKVAGKYSVKVTGSSPSNLNIRLFKNGAVYSYLTQFTTGVVTGVREVVLAVGDYISVEVETSVAIRGYDFSSYQMTAIDISLLSGSQQIVAGEKCISAYMATTTTAASTDISFSTKVIDTHGAWDGDSFTCVCNGDYEIHAKIFIGSSAGSNTRLNVYKNASLYSCLEGFNNTPSGGSDITHQGSILLPLIVGDIITFQWSGGGAMAAFSGSDYGSMYIKRLNY